MVIRGIMHGLALLGQQVKLQNVHLQGLGPSVCCCACAGVWALAGQPWRLRIKPSPGIRMDQEP